MKSIYEQVLTADPRSDMHKEKAEAFLDADRRRLAQTGSQRRKEEAHSRPCRRSRRGLAFKVDSQTPTGLYNAMIIPFVPMSIRGAIWYQGESNAYEGMLYTKKMQALIGGWRRCLQPRRLPLLLRPDRALRIRQSGHRTSCREFWEAQQAAMEIPNTGMASTVDIADLKDIHPKNKQEVGRRLALWALAKTYGKQGIEYSGPVFKEMKQDGDKLRISFDHVGGGLVSRDGKPLNWFEVIDAETGGFVPATAQIDGTFARRLGRECQEASRRPLRLEQAGRAEPLE